jgi:hypothetical protein
MKIEIEMLKDNDDGSADFRLDTDEEGAKYLLAYGFEHALREGIKNMKVELLDDEKYFEALRKAEDQAWEELQRLNDIQQRNKASMAAWSAAGMFITENADKLGRLTLREAFEQGFSQGYKFAKEK